jgi:Family of unknown function (DUF6962)
MNEPVTLVTDYILAIASTIFGLLLWRRAVRLWALAFFFTAAGTFFGGTHHGFGGVAWWKATVYSIGLASLFLLAGTTRNRFVRAIAVIGFAGYAIWMVNHDDFIYVIIDYGATLMAVTVVQIAAWMRDRALSTPWVIGGVIVSIIAAVVQQAPIPYHNDVYHAIQLVALWLLYRGGTFMTTATERSTIQPM